ncbi:MAG: SusC/RagA family TonB-linked outer membrane protein [Bacteroidota bacterium]
MRNTFKIGVLLAIMCYGSLRLLAQDTIMVKGVVRSNLNEPVPNVSVSIEGSALLPVVTNDSGVFRLPAASANSWIIISPTGDYKKRRIYLNSRKELNLYLSSTDMISGDDPLTILSQDVLRRDMVASHAELSISDRHYGTALTVDEQMQGRIPGMYVVNRSGDMGSGAVTTIRGINSVYATNQPLYIVDGIPISSLGLFGSNLYGFEYNPLLSVNAFDISKTTVIKDPVYTAAYGSKGSNGIIFIKTLDPSVTQTSIELDMRTGYSLAPSNLIPQMDAGQHKTYMNEILFSSGMNEEVIREEYPGLFLEQDDDRFIDYQHNTNWQEQIFNNALFYNLNVKVKGGDEIARYGLSFGYLSGEGIIKNTGFEGYNLRFVSLLNIFTWLKMNAGVSLNYNSSALKEAAIVRETSPILSSLAKSPLLNPFQYDLEGNELTTISEVDEIGISNPLATVANYEASNTNYNFTSSLGLVGTLSRDLTLNSNFSFNYDVLKENLFLPNRGMELYFNREAFNVSKASNNDLNSFYNNTYLLYNKALGTDHAISSNTGFNMLSNKYQFDWGLTKNAHENDEYRSLQDGQNNLREIGGANRAWNWISFYENLSYAFRDKYLVTASLSLDGSSRLGENAVNSVRLAGQPFGIFYSAGLAWRLSNESFLKNITWIENLKIRFSAGKTGNDDIGESSANDYYQAVKFRETVGLYPALITNDKLTYETVSQINGGIDISLLGNRFMLSADYFISTTHDMIIFSPIEAYLGYDFLIENGGSMRNSGIELSTSLRVVDRHAFHWDVQAYLTKMENEVTKIKGNKLVYTIPGAEKVNQEGSPANSFYGYIYHGVYSTMQAASEANLRNDKGNPYQAGDAIFEDLSGPEGEPDGFINEFDKTMIGSSLPETYGGLINSLSLFRWTLRSTLQIVYGNEVFNYVRYQNENMAGLANQSTHVLDRWQYDGHETDVPRATWEDPQGNSDFSTRWIEDGSFLRVKNITLVYSVPNQFLFFKNAEFYVSVNNIFTLSNYLGYDPEFAYSQSQIYQGVDYGLTPHPRQFIAGIKIGL